MINLDDLRDDDLLDIHQVSRTSKTVGDPVIAVSRATFMSGVQQGLYPKPIFLSKRKARWKVSDLRDFLKNGMPISSKAMGI